MNEIKHKWNAVTMDTICANCGKVYGGHTPNPRVIPVYAEDYMCSNMTANFSHRESFESIVKTAQVLAGLDYEDQTKTR